MILAILAPLVGPLLGPLVALPAFISGPILGSLGFLGNGVAASMLQGVAKRDSKLKLTANRFCGRSYTSDNGQRGCWQRIRSRTEHWCHSRQCRWRHTLVPVVQSVMVNPRQWVGLLYEQRMRVDHDLRTGYCGWIGGGENQVNMRYG